MPGAAPTVAVDWSGRRTGVKRHLWLAEVRAGALVRLECGRDRAELVEHLVDLAAAEPALVVGLDFAFSLPVWFLRSRDLSSAPALWRLAEREAEAWLAACEPPFWGRPGRPRPALPAHFRATEAALPPVAGVRPKSAFQVGGAGAVGTGTLRGLPALARLRGAGFSVWPFDPPTPPVAVEIYPRLLTGPVRKSDPASRATSLRTGPWPRPLPPGLERLAASGEDAFDAAVSALRTDEHRAELLALPCAADEATRLEGAIWAPAARP